MKPPFTLYDLRGDWCTDETKKNILKQLNKKAIDWYHENTFLNTLKQFDNIADSIKYDFTSYMWEEDFEGDAYAIQEYGQWIGDPGGVADFGEGNFFFHLSDMYEVLKYKYHPKVVEAHYYYSIKYRGKDGEYGINLKNFSNLYNGQDVENFAEIYHAKIKLQREYWSSPVGKAETEKQMQELKEKYLLPYLKENEINDQAV